MIVSMSLRPPGLHRLNSQSICSLLPTPPQAAPHLQRTPAPPRAPPLSLTPTAVGPETLLLLLFLSSSEPARGSCLHCQPHPGSRQLPGLTCDAANSFPGSSLAFSPPPSSSQQHRTSCENSTLTYHFPVESSNCPLLPFQIKSPKSLEQLISSPLLRPQPLGQHTRPDEPGGSWVLLSFWQTGLVHDSLSSPLPQLPS